VLPRCVRCNISIEVKRVEQDFEKNSSENWVISKRQERARVRKMMICFLYYSAVRVLNVKGTIDVRKVRKKRKGVGLCLTKYLTSSTILSY
jgi:hypothetical protein